MKKRLIFALIASVCCFGLGAQNRVAPEGYEYVDSVVYRPTAAVDPELEGKSIWSVLPSDEKGDAGRVTVNQSQEMFDMMNNHIAKNAKKAFSGYRIRIFFDNNQNARNESQAILSKFSSSHPDIPAYRSYANPFFKVAVGDFRTKSEAMEALEQLKTEYPAAFIIKESINYPVVDKHNSYITDTVSVLRPVSDETTMEL